MHDHFKTLCIYNSQFDLCSSVLERTSKIRACDLGHAFAWFYQTGRMCVLAGVTFSQKKSNIAGKQNFFYYKTITHSSIISLNSGIFFLYPIPLMHFDNYIFKVVYKEYWPLADLSEQDTRADHSWEWKG